ncbi:BT0820 family HAD-type phosphatase [Carboxylicivirga marina]|uniref:Hydrolase n=1 Tax=Carboxylicivirga marina TaxID=2800988 RepID=A0ABS1HGX2_9BACT|nr:hydrolase [Carboxylicivirga marina]MBK3516925.1 hydrolase [Carboxylicivirga marina]
MIIAVDFDGTIVDHKYPRIGKEKTFAFETLKSLQDKGHLLILWTIRTGKELDEAVEYCRKNGIVFYAVNRTHPEEETSDNISRKVNADVFIDDRNVGGFMGWGEIWQWINKDASSSEKDNYHKQYQKAKRQTLCGFLQALFCR